MLQTIQSLFQRDITRLINEIKSYSKEENIWKTESQISNSAGNLCLHLIGNLNTYIGAEIGKTGYVRNRELEFSAKNVPRAELIEKLESTLTTVISSLQKLSPDQLDQEFPIQVFDKPTTTRYLLIHLTTHLAYHLGQINYHRRLLDL